MQVFCCVKLIKLCPNCTNSLNLLKLIYVKQNKSLLVRLRCILFNKKKENLLSICMGLVDWSTLQWFSPSNTIPKSPWRISPYRRHAVVSNNDKMNLLLVLIIILLRFESETRLSMYLSHYGNMLTHKKVKKM